MTTDVGTDLPNVECDASQVQQVVLALAMNAIEAMPDGGTLALRARRASQAEDAGVEIDVTDTGCGIPADVLPHVFEPFFTTKDHGNGVGLGLAVVYGIVERHHGSVDVRTEIGAGTTFTVRLPRKQPPSSTLVSSQSSTTPSATGSPADASTVGASASGRAPSASPVVSEGTVP
jgi:signal transduction histidine kinase